jgi:hypothetical protein
MSNLQIFSKHLKNTPTLFLYWGLSSAGEHMTEDHGVRGSTPRGPIKNLKTFIKVKKLKEI